MMKIVFLLTLILTSCGGGKTKWETERGYTKEESALIKEYFDQYNTMMANGATFGSSAFDQSGKVQASNKLNNIFCNCHKKLGSKCQQRPLGLNEDDKRIWAKSNAAESVLDAYSSPLLGGGPKADPDMCP